VHEQTETIDYTEEEITAWRKARPWQDERQRDRLPSAQPKRSLRTGRLRLLAPNGYRGGRVSWGDGQRGPAEHRIGSILRTFERRADDDDEAAVELARRMEQLRREEAAREERARRERIEHARVLRLRAEVAAWRTSAEIRAYLAALERNLPELGAEDRLRIAEWSKWARDWSERSDPVQQLARIHRQAGSDAPEGSRGGR
jgi:hypothetical protein